MPELITEKITREMYIWLAQEKANRIAVGNKRVKIYEMLADCIEAYKAAKRTQ